MKGTMVAVHFGDPGSRPEVTGCFGCPLDDSISRSYPWPTG